MQTSKIIDRQAVIASQAYNGSPDIYHRYGTYADYVRSTIGARVTVDVRVASNRWVRHTSTITAARAEAIIRRGENYDTAN